MVNLVILPPPRSPPEPNSVPSGDQVPNPIPVLGCPWGVPGVSPLSLPRGLSPQELGFPMETQPGGRGTPGTPGGLWAAPCRFFWGGSENFGGIRAF